MDTIDLKTLGDELYRHGLAGFHRIRDAHPRARFYCFAFYTNGEFNYVELTAGTYEGLDVVARKYQKIPSYSGMSIEDLRLDLKWSPCDSPLHGHADNVLTALDPLMHAVADELDRRFDMQDGGTSFREFTAEVEACFAGALTRIDAEGIFGRGTERKDVVVNLLMGDQSDEARIGFAQRVNPTESIEMLNRDLESASRLRR